MTDLTAAFSNLSSELANSITSGKFNSEDKKIFKKVRGQIGNILTLLQAKAINDSLNQLNDSATKLINVTARINSTIDEIRNADKILKETANLITAIGNLASAIGENNPQKIGQSIDILLTTTGF